MTDPLTLAAQLEQRASELAVVYPHMLTYADSMREAAAAIRTLVVALEQIAAHDGDRWIYEDDNVLQPKASPQEIAQLALRR